MEAETTTEELELKESETKIVSMKTIEQFLKLRNHANMKNKWEQYTKICENENEDWERIMERIGAFIYPIWEALCKDEIFFDDWMPELERFLS